jgi:hypothetical protein
MDRELPNGEVAKWPIGMFPFGYLAIWFIGGDRVSDRERP